MEYRLGNSRKIKSKGKVLELVCPNCNKEVQFGIFSNLERKIVIKPNLLDLNTVYFLVCPNCAEIYTVDEEIGNEYIKYNVPINPEELTKLKEFKPE